MRAALLLGLLALCASCLREVDFHCRDDFQCDRLPGGRCEAVGYCSYFDASCPSHQRFFELAGPFVGQCVGGGVPPPGDGAIDTIPDGSDAGCPADYQPLAGGPAGHVYRKSPGNLRWTDQDDFCRSTSPRAYLAVPDDATELTSLHSLAAGTFWVGVHDRVMEGTFLKLSTSTAATFLPWATGEPDDALTGQDCVAATATTFSDEECTGAGANRPAVCECEP